MLGSWLRGAKEGESITSTVVPALSLPLLEADGAEEGAVAGGAEAWGGGLEA